MKDKFGVILLILISTTLVALTKQSYGRIVKLNIPTNWPKPEYDFKSKPLTNKKVELGRKLFYDPILSKDESVSCASCHSSYTAFTHVDHALSHGINDSIGKRNSPVLINLAWQKSFMWDGAVNHIENQALAPIHNPLEMGSSIIEVVKKLNGIDTYKKMFNAAFGDTIITGQNILISIAQFELTLISKDSKYDKVMRGEKDIYFTDQEQSGYSLFKENCASCHVEPLFTSGKFENNGLPLDSILLDNGRYGITKNDHDLGKFKVPTLRNIEFSQPYMHDGRFNSLYDVLNHYTSGVVLSETLSDDLKKGLNLTQRDKIDIIAFLLTLTDQKFLFNPDYKYPKN